MERRLVRLAVPYTDVETAATTKTITLHATPANALIDGVLVNVTTAFSGGSISAITVQVGYSSDTDNLILPRSVASTGQIGAEPTDLGEALGNLKSYFVTSARTHQLLFTATGANLTDLTQGQLDAYIWYSVLPA